MICEKHGKVFEQGENVCLVCHQEVTSVVKVIEKKKFSKRDYMREYMRKRRLKAGVPVMPDEEAA